MKSLRSLHCCQANCLFFFSAAVLHFDSSILQIGFDSWAWGITYNKALLSTLDSLRGLGSVAGCFSVSRLALQLFFFFFFGVKPTFFCLFVCLFVCYMCNWICFMFFMGGSWQASSWLGLACFCYSCAYLFIYFKILILCLYIYIYIYISYW